MSIFILKILKTNHVTAVEPYSYVSIPSRFMTGKGVEVRLGFSIFCGKNYEITVQRITLLARITNK